MLWEHQHGDKISYECHTGHQFTDSSLTAETSSALEETLWSALRALQEGANLRRRMAKRSVEHGDSERAELFNQEAAEYEARAGTLRSIILRPLRSAT